MADLAVGWGCPEVLAFIKALGIPEEVKVCACDICIRADEIIMARLEVPVSNEALAILETVAARSEGRIVILKEDDPCQPLNQPCLPRSSRTPASGR